MGYANEPTVELFLNGRSLGAKSFDQKVSTDGVHYLETTECTGDDKNDTGGACPGSYQSPNGSSGKLHLTWNVPFEAGRLVAVATDARGRVVARDEVDTAGAPYALKLTPDKTILRADGKSLSYVTVHVVDRHGVEVPDADNPVAIDVSGAGSFVGADNGKEDDAEGYKATTHDAFNGKLLAIVQSSTHSGPITITAAADGLRPAGFRLYSIEWADTAWRGRETGPVPANGARSGNAPVPSQPTADASFTGGFFGIGSFSSDFGNSTTLPATMLDGDTTTFWSNRYSKVRTQTLADVTNAHSSDWVSVSWPATEQVGEIDARFIIDANDQLPAAVTVSYWNGSDWVPVSDQHVSFASASNDPSTITFDPVAATQLKLDMTSASPGDPVTGNLAISELTFGWT